MYLAAIGEVRYGVLAVAWILTGHFGLFELGMGRATAYSIARSQTSEATVREEILSTALFLSGMLGAIGSLVFIVVVYYAYGVVFTVGNVIESEVIPALTWIALTIPIATLSSVGRGVLQGLECFVALNILETTTVVLSQTAPLAAAWYVDAQLANLVVANLAARTVCLIVMFAIIRRKLPVRRVPVPSLVRARALLAFGGWVSLSSAITPLLTTLDRILIAAVRGTVHVTYYTIPVNVAQRFCMIAGSLATTLFPRFAIQNSLEQTSLAQRAVLALSAILTPALAISALLVSPLFAMWLGGNVSNHAAPIGVIALLGVWFNSLAYVPFVLLQGRGSPRMVALTHLAESPVYVCALYFAIREYGAIGAACVMVARASIDGLVLMKVARISVRPLRPLLPNMLVLVVCQIAGLTLETFTPVRAIISVTVACVLTYLGCQYSADFRELLRRGCSVCRITLKVTLRC